MIRSILHLYVPDFPVAVERVARPALADRAVVIAPPGSVRATVLAASEQARQSGIAIGMKLNFALKLCHNAIVLPPNEGLYRRAAVAADKILASYSPTVEPSSGGRFFVDLTGTHRLFGPSKDAAAVIQREIKQRLRLVANIGLATNKSVSQVASAAQPAGLCDVLPGLEAPFLSPWKVLRLPGAGQVKEPALFDDLNIRLIGELAAFSPGQLSLVFGRPGTVLHQRSNGIDPRPVLPPGKEPSVSEQHVLEEDSNNRDKLLAYLYHLTEKSGYRLRKGGFVASTLTLRIVYADGLHAEGKCRISPPSWADDSLFTALRPTFYRTMVRRVRVRFLGVEFTGLSRAQKQLALFRPKGSARHDALVQAVDAIRNKYGVSAIGKGFAA